LAERRPWKKDEIALYRGQAIACVDESGRHFWAWRAPGEWSLRREYGSFADAMRDIDEYLDKKETKRG
jgi:hypothetical protein